MKEKNNNLLNQVLSNSELNQIIGGGDADDIAYNLTYFAIRSNPLYWLAKYDEWIIKSLFT